MREVPCCCMTILDLFLIEVLNKPKNTGVTAPLPACCYHGVTAPLPTQNITANGNGVTEPLPIPIPALNITVLVSLLHYLQKSPLWRYYSIT